MKISTIIENMKKYHKGYGTIDEEKTRDKVLYGNVDQECTGIVTLVGLLLMLLNMPLKKEPT